MKIGPGKQNDKKKRGKPQNYKLHFPPTDSVNIFQNFKLVAWGIEHKNAAISLTFKID